MPLNPLKMQKQKDERKKAEETQNLLSQKEEFDPSIKNNFANDHAIKREEFLDGISELLFTTGRVFRDEIAHCYFEKDCTQ